MIPIKFNFKDIVDLNEDLKQSPKALTAISRRVLTLQLRKLRNQLQPSVPRERGKLRTSLGASVRNNKSRSGIWAIFGFLRSKRVSAGTAIAANVLQHPGATAKKSQDLWIPLTAGAAITPQLFFAMPNTFIRQGPSGNKIAFHREGDTLVPLFVLKKTVRLSAPPLPIEERVENALPDIAQDLQTTIAQVLEARGAVIRQAGL